MKIRFFSGTSTRPLVVFSILLAVTLCLAEAAGAAQRQLIRGQIPRAVQERNLQPIARMPSSTNLTLAIGLPLRNQAALAKLLRDLYDPASPNFHHYLTSDQFRDMFGPTEQDYQSLIQFATDNGIPHVLRHEPGPEPRRY